MNLWRIRLEAVFRRRDRFANFVIHDDSGRRLARGELIVGHRDGQYVSDVTRLLAGSDQDNYQLAFDLLKNGRYVESAQAFDQFLAIFPSSPLADNAQYWLAETYYVQRQFTTALPTFQAVVDTYPDSSQLPDALLKIGFCNYALQRWDAARAALQRVAREFTDTTVGRLASQRLDRLTQEQG